MATPTVTDSGIATGASAGTSRTVAATVTGGNFNTFGIVFLWNITGNSFTGVTWNGVAMTSGAVNTPAFAFRSQLYYISNPGTGNIVVSWSGADTSVGVAWAVTKDSVQGAIDVEGYNSLNTVTSISKSVTTGLDNELMLAAFATAPTTSSETEGGTQTLLQSSHSMGATNYYAEITSDPKLTAGSNSMSLSWTTAKAADALVVAIKYQTPIKGGTMTMMGI